MSDPCREGVQPEAFSEHALLAIRAPDLAEDVANLAECGVSLHGVEDGVHQIRRAAAGVLDGAQLFLHVALGTAALDSLETLDLAVSDGVVDLERGDRLV